MIHEISDMENDIQDEPEVEMENTQDTVRE